LDLGTLEREKVVVIKQWKREESIYKDHLFTRADLVGFPLEEKILILLFFLAKFIF
jgi:hypothetical protein